MNTKTLVYTTFYVKNPSYESLIWEWLISLRTLGNHKGEVIIFDYGMPQELINKLNNFQKMIKNIKLIKMRKMIKMIVNISVKVDNNKYVFISIKTISIIITRIIITNYRVPRVYSYEDPNGYHYIITLGPTK